MGRYQRGYIYEAFGAFHVRYRLEEIVDGAVKRVQRSKRLCTKDKEHPTTSSKSVRRLCDEFMATVNAQVPNQPAPTDFTIAALLGSHVLALRGGKPQAEHALGLPTGVESTPQTPFWHYDAARVSQRDGVNVPH